MKVFYFSGSGNSLSVAKQIDGDAINIACCSEKSFSDDSIGIVFPVYCYDIPLIVKRFLLETVLDAPYIWAVATCGSSVGYSFYSIDKLLKRQTKSLSYCKKILMPDSCIIFKTPSGERTRMLADEPTEVAGIKQEITSRMPLPPFKDKPFRLSAAAWWGIKSLLGAKRKKASDACNGCRICEQLCPTHNIKVDGKPVFGDNCEYCFGCIQWCPQRAIEFGRLKIDDASKHTHPSISAAEMIRRNK